MNVWKRRYVFCEPEYFYGNGNVRIAFFAAGNMYTQKQGWYFWSSEEERYLGGPYKTLREAKIKAEIKKRGEPE